MSNPSLKKTNLTKEDILEFARITASSADDCVREIDGLIAKKSAKEKELADLEEAQAGFDVEEKVKSRRERERISKDIRDLDKNIEVVSERGLVFERSCDVNQAVASQLEGREVNFRTTRRLAEMGDVEEDVKELRSRLASKEKRQAAVKAIKGGGRGTKGRFFWRVLVAIAIVVIIILLLLRQCGGVDGIIKSVYSIIGFGDLDIGVSDDSLQGEGWPYRSGSSADSAGIASFGGSFGRSGSDEGDGRTDDGRDVSGAQGSGAVTPDADISPVGRTATNHNQVSSDEWRRVYTGRVMRDDLVTIPYKDPNVPFDDLEIEYYLLEGDFASGFNALTGLISDRVFDSRVSIEDLVTSYSEDRGIEEAAAAPLSIAEQLEQEDMRRALRLDPNDPYYAIDITNSGTSRQEIVDKMQQESPYVEMAPIGPPFELSAGVMPYAFSFSGNNGSPGLDNSFDPANFDWPLGLDLAAHYKIVNEESAQVGVGVRAGVLANIKEVGYAISGQGVDPKLDFPVMAELKGKVGNFEAYAGLGPIMSLNRTIADGANSPFHVYFPAVELGIGGNIPLATNHSSLSIGAGALAGWDGFSDSLPARLVAYPYVRYTHAFDAFEPVDNYYYDIEVENEAVSPSDYGYDILIENDDIGALRKKQEAQNPDNVVSERLTGKGLDIADEYYDILVENDSRLAVRRDEKVSGASQEIAEAAIAALMAGDSRSYDIILNEDAASSADRSRIINEYYNRYRFYEYEKLNNEWLASQDLGNNARLSNLYGDDVSSGAEDSVEEVSGSYIAEEVYEGVPIDMEVHIGDILFSWTGYPWKKSGFFSSQTQEAWDESYAGSQNVYDSSSIFRLLDSNRPHFYPMNIGSGAALSLGLRWRVINGKDFQLFVGTKAAYQLHFNSLTSFDLTPLRDEWMALAEIGIGFVGFNVYLGGGASWGVAPSQNSSFKSIFSNIGWALNLGLDYTIRLSQHVGFVLGANANLAVGVDRSNDKTGGVTIEVDAISVNPYIGLKFSFDGRTIRYKNQIPTPERQYRILVDRGDDSFLTDPLDGLTFDELESEATP